MAQTEFTPEQNQLREEIKAVLTNIGKGDAGTASYEIEQGRKLIEKAVKIGLPEEAYADLQRRVSTSGDKAGA